MGRGRKFLSGKKSLGDSQLVFSLALGAAGGILIAHLFKTQINTLWSDIPYINKIKANN
jgi:hypothetical protein